jgi:hypothetical protein
MKASNNQPIHDMDHKCEFQLYVQCHPRRLMEVCRAAGHKGRTVSDNLASSSYFCRCLSRVIVKQL